MKVGLLPHAKFVRDCSHGTRGAVVVHCVSRSVDAKRGAPESAGAWVLRDDWRDVADLRHMGVTQVADTRTSHHRPYLAGRALEVRPNMIGLELAALAAAEDGCARCRS